MNELLSRLEESKKPLDREEVDALVAMIAELDDKPKTISEDEVVSMTKGSGREQGGQRWAREKNRARISQAVEMLDQQKSQLV